MSGLTRVPDTDNTRVGSRCTGVSNTHQAVVDAATSLQSVLDLHSELNPADLYGVFYRGGYLFDYDENTKIGLVFAPREFFGQHYVTNICTDGAGHDLCTDGNDGANNTAEWMRQSSIWDTAIISLVANLTDGIYDDWFSPATMQLDKLYDTVKLKGFTRVGESNYTNVDTTIVTSSTYGGSGQIGGVNFANGEITSGTRWLGSGSMVGFAIRQFED